MTACASHLKCSRWSRRGGLSAIPWLVILFVCASVASAQQNATLETGDRRPERGNELEIWTGAGGDPIGTPKITLGNSMWNLGVRYGWVLTDAHGPGFLRGRFEYAVDVLPALIVFQPRGKVYGFGFDPWIMKWNFEAGGRILPYIEIGGGCSITTRAVPAGAGAFNFTPTGAIGVNLLRGKYHWSIDVRYFHMSTAQLTDFNPGTDTFGVRIGWGVFTHAK